MAGAVMEITESKFEEEVLQESMPVLVDFWAPWCGPCKTMGPILEEIAAANEGRLKVVKLNVDENQNLAQQYDIMSIPTMFLFKNGQVADSFMGVMNKQALTEKLEQHI